MSPTISRSTSLRIASQARRRTDNLIPTTKSTTKPPTPYPSPGAKLHYVFKIGHYGVGYYKDEPPAIEVTAESLLEEEVAIKKRRANNTFGVGKFDVWSD